MINIQLKAQIENHQLKIIKVVNGIEHTVTRSELVRLWAKHYQQGVK